MALKISDVWPLIPAWSVLFFTVCAVPIQASNLLEPYHSAVTRRFALDNWELRIQRNRFSGEVGCRLSARDHHGAYAGSAVAFYLGKHIDTTLATYRLDGGPALRWRDQMPELVRLGTPMDGPGLEDPTGGFVWLPLSTLQGVNRVVVQATPDRRPKAFLLRGFVQLLNFARSQGCPADQNYVR